MTRKILIVKPYSKLTAAHKLFATFMKLLIMSKIEIIDKSASTYCFTNPDFLLLCWIYFRLEALQQFPHPFLSVFYTYEAHTACMRTHGVLKQYPARVLPVAIVLHCFLHFPAPSLRGHKYIIKLKSTKTLVCISI